MKRKRRGRQGVKAGRMIGGALLLRTISSLARRENLLHQHAGLINVSPLAKPAKRETAETWRALSPTSVSLS